LSITSKTDSVDLKIYKVVAPKLRMNEKMVLNFFVKYNAKISLTKGLFSARHTMLKNKTPVNITLSSRLQHSGMVDSLVNKSNLQIPCKHHHIPVMHQEVLGKVFNTCLY
jgi:hypothetical protein